MKPFNRILSIITLIALIFCLPAASAASEPEGTRHIMGDDVDLYFMNDKVFGTINGDPLWAIYNCGSDITGEIDQIGMIRKFSVVYGKTEDHISTGTFGDTPFGLRHIEKKPDKFLYHVYVGDRTYVYSIRYEMIEDMHMLNSVIEGPLDSERRTEIRVDGKLCPFATSGVILIIAGASL